MGIAGLIVGSLLTALAASWPSFNPFPNVWERCSTGSPLRRAIAMVPLLGTAMVLMSDRCASKLPRRVLLVELVTGSIYAAVGVKLGVHPFLLAYLIFFSGLVVLAEIDLEQQLIPKRIVYTTLLLCMIILIVYSLLQDDVSRLVIGVICGIIAFGFFLLIHLLIPSGMGFGDVRLSGLIGGLLGWLRVEDVFAGFISAFFLAGIVGIVLLIFAGRTRKTRIPFAPFMGAGALVAVLWGSLIIRTWLRI